MKKNMSVCFIMFSVFCCFRSMGNPIGGNPDKPDHLNPPTEDSILVGHRTSDSTATISISMSDIQHNVIAIIPELDSCSITNDAVSIRVNKITGYLLFKVINASGKRLSVALELVLRSADFSYQVKSGRQVHICQSAESCNSCAFIFAEVWIVDCKCESQNRNTSSLIRDCQDQIILSH
jgi:hypothetical protein